MGKISIQVDGDKYKSIFKDKSELNVDITGECSVVGDAVDSDVVASAVKDYLDSNGVSVTETDPTVPDWAKASTKPTYTASEVGALPDTTAIPSKTSELTNDSEYLTSADLPTSLKNPSALKFTGASTVSYDGSSSVTVNIPSAVTVDSSLSVSSTNPVQNKVIQSALANKADATTVNTLSTNLENLQQAAESTFETGLKSPNKITFTGAVSAEYDGSEAVTVEIPTVSSSGDSAVTSVNSKTGAVILTASDVGALPDTTTIPSTLSDLSDYESTANALNSTLSTMQTNIAANTSAKHAHSNKTVLDSITGIVTSSNISSPDNTTDLVDYSAFQVGSQMIIDQIPSSLKNPNALTFTGAVTGSYDGSAAMTIEIPEESDITIDTALNGTSTNAVTNAAVYEAIQALIERVTTLEDTINNVAEYSQVNDTVAAYLTASESYVDGETTSVIGDYADGTQLLMPSGYGSGYTGTMSVAGTTTASYSYDISDSAILNVVPNEVSTVSVTGTSALSAIKLRPTGYLRALNIGVYNVRDLGGWECDGGRVAYNKIIRGTQLVTSAGAQLVTDTGKDVLLKAVGIKAELNWQETTEDGAITESILGSDINFKRCPLNIDNGYSDQISGDNLPIFIEGIQWGMEQVIAGNPVYIHCSAGADRTGIASFVFNAVLGVAEHDLDRDYELTRLGNIYNTTLTRGVANWTNFKTKLKGYTGDTLRDSVIYFLRENGIPMDTINGFRVAMSTGTPDTLDDPISAKTNLIPTSVDTDFTTVYGYKSGYRTNSSGTLSAKDGYYATGIMPIQYGQTITFENMKLPKAGTVSSYFAYTAIQYWNSSKTFMKQDYFYTLVGVSDNTYTDDDGYITSITINANSAGTDLSDMAWFRISCEYIDDTSAIYVE